MAALFPKFETLEDVRKAARSGAIAGLFFAGMNALGLALMFFGVQLPGDTDPVSGSDQIASMAGVGIELIVILLFSWRVSTGKGYVSAIALLLLFLLEIFLKIAGGTSNVGWMFAYAFIALGMFNAIRATLVFKKFARIENMAGAF